MSDVPLGQAPHNVSSGNGGPPQHGQNGPDGPRRRRRRGGRNRGRGEGSGQQQSSYQDPAEEAWANQHNDAHDSDTEVPPAPETAPVHHEKIHLPEAFAALGLESALLHALADINFVTPSEIQQKLI